jgi:hypothetical protein
MSSRLTANSPLTVVKKGKATLRQPSQSSRNKYNNLAKQRRIKKQIADEYARKTAAIKKRKAIKEAAEETPATQAKKGGTIKRRGGGGVSAKKTKGTKVSEINRRKGEWEEAPMEGTPGPYNPQKHRVKKKEDTSVIMKKLPTDYQWNMSDWERERERGLAGSPRAAKAHLEYEGDKRKRKRAAKETPATQAKKGGTLGTGAAVRGLGKGYKKGGTI